MKFYDCIEKNKDKNISIYCDMDGVLAEYDIGNFDYESIRPLTSTIKKIEDLYKEDNKYQGISSKEIKSNYLKENAKNDVNIVIDDDNSVIKYIIKNNEDLIVFQDSSLVD